MWKLQSTHAVASWQGNTLEDLGLSFDTEAEANKWWDCWSVVTCEKHIRKVVTMLDPKGSVVKVRFE